MTDARIERIERGIATRYRITPTIADAALADLRAWQEIAERHSRSPKDGCCINCVLSTPNGEIRYWPYPCRDRQAADAAIDRLDGLWGTELAATALASDAVGS